MRRAGGLWPTGRVLPTKTTGTGDVQVSRYVLCHIRLHVFYALTVVVSQTRGDC